MSETCLKILYWESTMCVYYCWLPCVTWRWISHPTSNPSANPVDSTRILFLGYTLDPSSSSPIWITWKASQLTSLYPLCFSPWAPLVYTQYIIHDFQHKSDIRLKIFSWLLIFYRIKAKLLTVPHIIFFPLTQSILCSRHTGVLAGPWTR